MSRATFSLPERFFYFPLSVVYLEHFCRSLELEWFAARSGAPAWCSFLPPSSLLLLEYSVDSPVVYFRSCSKSPLTTHNRPRTRKRAITEFLNAAANGQIIFWLKTVFNRSYFSLPHDLQAHKKFYNFFAVVLYIASYEEINTSAFRSPAVSILFGAHNFAYPSYRTRSTSSYRRRNILKSMNKSGPPSEMESAYLCVGEWWPCMLSEPRCISSLRSWFAHRI